MNPPKAETQKTPVLFTLGYKDMAVALLGKELIVGTRSGVILGAQGYSKKENTGVYLPVTEMQPGEVFTPKQRTMLLLIACKDGKDIGGCVLIRSVEINGVVYDGPGKLCTAFGLVEPRQAGAITIVDEDTLALNIATVAPPKIPVRTPRVQNGNGIGMETLRLHMPKIIKAYAVTKAGDVTLTFKAFLDQLLLCESEKELKKRIS